MGPKLLAKNKKAYFDYEVLEKYEAGIVLLGPEVRSIKEGKVQLKGSFATVINGRVVVENMHVSQYKYAANVPHDPLRHRELLLRKKEIDHLSGMSIQKGFTLIPLEMFLKKNLIKVLLGICRGKRQHDKRDVLRKRAIARDIDQELKKFSR